MELRRLSSGSSTSSDEEALEFINNISVSRFMRFHRSPLEMYTDDEFKMRYRFNKQTVLHLCDELNSVLRPLARRNFTLTVLEQVLISLRFYATGTFLIVIGDDLNIHKTTVSRIVYKVSKEIAKLSHRHIFMPRSEVEMGRTKSLFYDIARFPNVIGCIDGTHIPIQSPGGNNAELYRNRKAFFSLNVQAVCDANLVIRDIDARWYGSTHDSTIFHNSLLRARLENNEFSNGYLLGDSAYPCNRHVLTPFLNTVGIAEERYNKAHIKTRSTIERTFGVWKRRFPCLSQKLRVKMDCVLAVIVATAVLHNIALENSDYLEVEEVQDLSPETSDNEIPGSVQGNSLRRSIVTQYFRYVIGRIQLRTTVY